jgi:ribosomal protein S27E
MAAANNPSVRPASYAPCYDCNEGTVVWDHESQTSRCRECGCDL